MPQNQNPKYSVVCKALIPLFSSSCYEMQEKSLHLLNCDEISFGTNRWEDTVNRLFAETAVVDWQIEKIVSAINRRRWYNGQHSCLPSSWSGFDSRPTQCFKFYFGQNWDKKVLSMPWPGFEPGLLRPQRRVLTTRRSRLRTVVLMRRTFVLAYYQKC